MTLKLPVALTIRPHLWLVVNDILLCSIVGVVIPSQHL